MCQKWELFGKRAGYPKCCIESFIQRDKDIDNRIPPSRLQKRVGNRTGFIPCSFCTWKVESIIKSM